MTAVLSPASTPTAAAAAPADRPTAVAAIAGGVAVVAGAALPWLSLLAGLQVLTGLDGTNGRLLAAGGVVAVALGAANLRSASPALRAATGLFGFALLGLSSWLLLALLTTFRELSADPLTLAQLGPGLFVATLGAAAVFSPLLRRAPAGVPAEASTAPAPRAPWAAAVPVTVAAASVLAGVLHLALSGEHFAEGFLSGASFLAIGVAQLAWAALAVLRPTRRLLLRGAALHGTAILAWAGAESGMLGFLHAGGHHGQGPALATVVAEAVVVAGCLVAAHRTRST